MKALGKRDSAFAAELLAEHLLQVYKNEQIPQSVEDFCLAGFSRESLAKNPDQLFRMIVLAAYDRRPFTQAVGGYERIWEMGKPANGVPSLLHSRQLWSVHEVLLRSIKQLETYLDGLTLGDLHLSSDGARTFYANTLIQAAQLVKDGFLDQLKEVSSSKDIRTVFDRFDSVHGIGETIASKLVKYTLREIAIGKVQPAEFPLDVAWPITQEYHAESGAALLQSLSPDIPALTAGILYKKGDAYAIDALFYLNRRKSNELEEFINEIRLVIPSSLTKNAIHPVPALANDTETCKQLLEIIADVRDATLHVSQVELEKNGITRGIKTAKQVNQSGTRLYHEMERIAQTGSVSEMVNYYENCLKSSDGQLYDWILSKLGRKCLASEKDRFLQIASRIQPYK